MTIVREGIATNAPMEFSTAGAPEGSIWGSIGGWLSDTVGTYASNARDQWFAREGISSGSPSDTIQKDANAQGDISGKAVIAQPIYKNPYVIGGTAIALVGLFFLVKK